ncbi:MAG: methylated-DNA--[protein]-cysteine S-methyltransferase [Ignavibacteriales bacterium]|nr:methylated-DNA--[protein]-cysteine S-methyltransferase [Ignavibacteriales bacterium]
MLDDVETLEISNITTTLKKKLRSESETVKQIQDDENSLSSAIYCTSFDSRIGRIYIASTEKGVCKVSLPHENRKDFVGWLKKHFDLEMVSDNRLKNKDVIDQFTRYFNGRLAQFHCSLDLIGTPFQIRVWKELAKIPYGSTITYKHLAKRVHAPKAFQAVGRANGANPLPIIIPCHRVIGSDGSLVGYAYGVKTKEFLLRLEGVLML